MVENRFTKWKYKALTEIERFSARLVANGYSQTEGIDYKETFSPVVKMVTLGTILAIAGTRNWHIYQMDLYNAFLQWALNDEIKMELPYGLKN